MARPNSYLSTPELEARVKTAFEEYAKEYGRIATLGQLIEFDEGVLGNTPKLAKSSVAAYFKTIVEQEPWSKLAEELGPRSNTLVAAAYFGVKAAVYIEAEDMFFVSHHEALDDTDLEHGPS